MKMVSMVNIGSTSASVEFEKVINKFLMTKFAVTSLSWSKTEFSLVKSSFHWTVLALDPLDLNHFFVQDWADLLLTLRRKRYPEVSAVRDN